jgi:hypothetical protein
MEKPPMEWIDKLFNCMKEFYTERWTRIFKNEAFEALFKTIWQSALQGLNYEQIRDALVFYKRQSRIGGIKPPSPVQFCILAKYLKK